MKYLMWLLKAAIFFTLFAFALNNQQDATVHFFFGTAVARAAGAGGAGRLRARPGGRRAGHGAALVEAPQRRRARRRASRRAPVASRRRTTAATAAHAWTLTSAGCCSGLPIAFVLGWLASRFDLRQLRIENRQAPKAYFRGLNFLLNEQQDQAIDAFIEAVQNDPDTSELHFALGNLFRRRGEYERAVRVHEHLLSRGDLSRADRDRAQHALALDFLKAGLLDRAEEALRKLEGTRYENEARLALLAIYERSRDWAQAADVAQKLDDAGPGQLRGAPRALPVRAGRRAARRRRPGRRRSAAASRPSQLAPQAPRPAIDIASLQLRHGQRRSRLRHARRALSEIAPLALAAVCRRAAAGGRRLAAAHARGARRCCSAAMPRQPSIDVLEAIIALGGVPRATAAEAAAGHPSRRDARSARRLHRAPGAAAFAGGRLALAGRREASSTSSSIPQVQRALDQAARPLMRYRCAACGFEAHQHFWQCPGCQAWDSYPPRRVEEL